MKFTKRGLTGLLSAAMIITLIPSGNNVAAKKPKLSKTKVTAEAGKEIKISVKNGNKKARVTWTTNKKSITKIKKKTTAGKTAYALIKCLKAGKATLTAKYKLGKKVTKLICRITVSDKKPVITNTQAPTSTAVSVQTPTAVPVTAIPKVQPIISTNKPIVNPVTAVKLEEEDYVTIEVGDTYNLKSDITPAGSDMEFVKFESCRDWVASVDNTGKVTAVYPGMTIITLSVKGKPSIESKVHVNVVDTEPAPKGFDTVNSSIQHGTIQDINYNSSYRESGTAHALAWFPPDYDSSKKYNVLFCLHGGTDNEYYWTRNCAGDRVLDCAYANMVMEDAIVVFTSGVIPYDSSKSYPNVPAEPNITDWGKDHYLLEYEIIYDLLPMLKENYPIMEGSEHTAVCGLSMGGGQTLDIGLKNPDIFGYVGCFSAGPFAAADQKFVTKTEDAEMLNSKLKFFTIMVGSNDQLGDNNVRNFEQTCTKFEVNHLFVEEEGLGHEDACWNRNLYKFMKYAFK